MMQFVLKIAAIWITVFLISCGSKEKVKLLIVRDAANSSHLVFDEKDTVNCSGSCRLDSIFLSSDRHDYKWNGVDYSFTMPGNGAVLNLARKEFVVVALEYEDNNTGKNYGGYAPYLQPNFILVDSFLIFKKVFIERLKDPESLKNVLINILQAENGNYAPLTEQEKLYNETNYDTNQEVWGFKKIGSRQVFIPKFWDFDLDQEIPEQIVISRPKHAVGFSERALPETKTALLFSEDFLDYARSSPATFEVLDVRNYLSKM